MSDLTTNICVAGIMIALKSNCPSILKRQIDALYPYTLSNKSAPPTRRISIMLTKLKVSPSIRTNDTAYGSKFALVRCPTNPRNNIWLHEAPPKSGQRVVREFDSGVEILFAQDSYEFRFSGSGFQAATKVIYHALQQIIASHCAVDGRFLVHASAVETELGTILFVGQKRAGKTTCFLDAVINLGCKPLACDKVYLCRGAEQLTVDSHPSKFRVLPGTLQKFGAQLTQFIPPEFANADAEVYWKGESKGKTSIPLLQLEGVLKQRFSLSSSLLGIIFPNLGQRNVGFVNRISVDEARSILLANTFALHNTEFDDWIIHDQYQADIVERTEHIYAGIANVSLMSLNAAEETTPHLRKALNTMGLKR